MRRQRWTVAIGLFLALAPATVASAQTEEAVITVEAGPSAEAWFAGQCNDAVVAFQESTSFVLERTGDRRGELTVTYETSGTAEPGEHYEALPGEVVFEADDRTATIDVEVLAGDTTELVDLRVRVTDAEDYSPGSAREAAIQFVRPRESSLPPPECGFSFVEGERIERTIGIGATPERVVVKELRAPIELEVPPEGLRMAVTGGVLPPGLALAEDGRFTGAAGEPGTFESSIQACRTTPPGTCIVTSLLVTVSTGPTTTTTAPSPPTTAPSRERTATTIPETGTPATTTAGAGLAVAGLGLVLTLVARRRSAGGSSRRKQ